MLGSLMDAWGVLGFVMFAFPPTAILFLASVIKLVALLEEKTISWGKAFAWAAMISVGALIGLGFFWGG